MSDLINKMVSDWVVENYQTTAVFKKYGIDFCCGGKISIKDVCKKHNLSIDVLLKELSEVLTERTKSDLVENYKLNDLIDYIIQTHHSYILKTAPEIESLLNKIVEVHGDKHLELIEIKNIFKDVKSELLAHMNKEENILFPHIKELVVGHKNGTTVNPPHFKTIKNPIGAMESEHELVGEAFRKIRSLSNNLNTPEDACNTYKASFAGLIEFENDLYRHIHLENNILFPRAIILEDEMSR